MPSNQPPTPDPDLRRALEDIRRSLLDLTKRNRLLNFRFGKRAVRVVNDSADRAWSCLQGGSLVRLLPAPESVNPNEAELALVAASDSLFADQRKSSKRAALSSSQGWQPRFELEPDFAPSPSGLVLQSAHDDDELDARLAGLYSDTKLALQETGTNFLHLWLGGLEWNDIGDKTSGTYLAPLLVVPVALERELDRRSRVYTYRLRALDDELHTNITLREKLRAIADLDLPLFDSAAGCHDYLSDVQRLIKRIPAWRVRSFASISMLSFGKVLMYHDLDPERWPADQPLDRHPILRQLLRLDGVGNSDGADQSGGERPAARRIYPQIVVDADSSQHLALADAVEGKNLVIEGPPGTGKSQTIVNLLAAAAGAGKRVLFVGEKQAALEVVYDRLKAIGLDHLVLELHSNHAEKRSVLKALADSLQLRADLAPWPGFKARQEWDRRREQLGQYVSALNATAGATGWTVHQVLWRAKRAESQLGAVPSRLPLIDWPHAESVDLQTWQERAVLIQQYAHQHQRLLDSGSRPDTHPWSGASLATVSLFQEAELRGRLNSVRSQLSAFEDTRHAVGAVTGAELPGQLLAARSVVQAWRATPSLGTPVRPKWAAGLFATARSQSVLEFIDRAERNRREREDLTARWARATDSDTVRSACRASLDQCVTWAAVDATVADVRSQLSLHLRLRDAATELDRLVIACNESLSLTIERTVIGGRQAVAIADAAANLPAGAEGVRHPGLLAKDSDQLLQSRAPMLARTAERRAQVDEALRVGALPRDIAALLDIVQELERHALLRIVSPAAWRSQRVTKRAVRDGAYDRRRAIELLRGYADVIESEDQMAADGAFMGVCGPFWRGGYTDIAALTEARTWLRHTVGALAAAGAAHWAEAVGLADAAYLHALRRHSPNLATFQEHVDLLAQHHPEASSTLAELAVQANTDATAIADQLRTLGDDVPVDVPLGTLVGLLDRGDAIDTDTAILSKHSDGAAVMGDDFHGADSDLQALKASCDFVNDIRRHVADHTVAEWVLNDPAARVPALHEQAKRLAGIVTSVLEAAQAVLEIADCQFLSTSELEARTADELIRRVSKPLRSSESDFQQFWEFDRARVRLSTTPETDLYDLIAAGELTPRQLPFAHSYVFCRALAKRAFAAHEHLASFTEFEHSSIRQKFQVLDQQLISEYRARIASAVAQRVLPPGNAVGPVGTLTQAALIRHEISKEKRHIPLRQLFGRAGAAIQALKPIVMMSPLSAAQFLPPGQLMFDLVVMDEASQLRPEDAFGAVVRGTQLVVVGDRKQLPPTRFFDALADDPLQNDDTDEPDFAQQSKEADSILDLAHAVFSPSRLLQWHYRSKHESLIAFSNARFYDGRLVVFPSPVRDSSDRGVMSVYVPDAVYDSSRNLLEARRVVDLAIEHMSNSRESLGVVAMNVQQRDLLKALLDEALREAPAAQQFIEEREGTLDELFLKNLENVQGDERDVIIISMTYGPSPTGQVHQRFGPINSASGHRRLNVLFTRAKHRLVLVTSMRPEHVLPESAKHEGVKVLHDYLEYAATGKLGGVTWSGRPPDSDFEIEVAEALNRHGYETVAQLGVAGYYIDIVVRDPRSPGRFVLAVECDGATYHSAKSARDRDRLREAVLKGLGWRVHRIWSTAWFNNKSAEMKRLLDALPVAGNH